jgi:UPF0271 protein
LSQTHIDLNCDLGESYGRWTLGDDEALLGLITSANLACGLYAGDFSVMDLTVQRCQGAGVAIGAQPGYPDLQGFGRRAMAMTTTEIEQLVLYQVGALHGFCRANGAELRFVKPHGALYNRAAEDLEVARGVARGVARFSRDLPLVGLAGSSSFPEAAGEAGLRFVAEGFADRRYTPDGQLQSRQVAGSLLADPATAAEQARLLATEGAVIASDGTRLTLSAETVCVHGDTPGAPAIAAAVRAALLGAGVALHPFA